MRVRTKRRDDACGYRSEVPGARFAGGYPEWKLIDQTLGQSWAVRVGWGARYAVPYFFLATHWWQWALLPMQWVLGPIHAAIVHWCGHGYGRRTFDNRGCARRTLALDVASLSQ